MSRNSKRRTATADGWVQQARHEVVLPSGAMVTIRIPDLTALIETGEIPQNLLQEALSQAGSEEPKKLTPEDAAKERAFKDLVVIKTVVEPEVTPEMLDPKTGIPAEDKDMIVEFAMRQREFDVEGNHISGLHTSEQFRKFRGIANLYEDVEGSAGG